MASLTINGEQVDVESVAFTAADEHWNSYVLADGSTMRVKLVLGNVYRVPDQTDMFGKPVFIIESSNVVATDG